MNSYVLFQNLFHWFRKMYIVCPLNGIEKIISLCRGVSFYFFVIEKKFDNYSTTEFLLLLSDNSLMQLVVLHIYFSLVFSLIFIGIFFSALSDHFYVVFAVLSLISFIPTLISQLSDSEKEY